MAADSIGVMEDTRIEVNRISLHLVAAGPADGPAVILLHGFPEFWYGWRRQIGPLAAAGLRVLAPDQRGYNLSDKPEGVGAYGLDTLAADVISLADTIGREKVSLVGHDWGGIVAWWTALRHPERIDRVAILNAPLPAVMRPYARRHPTQVLRSWYVLFFQLPWLPEAMMRARDLTILQEVTVRSGRPGIFGEEDLQRYREAWSRPGALTAMVNWYRALRQPRKAPAGARISLPVLLIWGMRDAFLEPGLAEASLALCYDGRIVRFVTASHWVQHEEAEAVNAALIEFLRRGDDADS